MMTPSGEINVITKKQQTKFIDDCYRLYERKLYSAAYAILKDEGQAEDAVQDTFLNLLRKEVYFEDATSEDCRRFILTVIKNVAINRYRKNQREREHEMLAEEETLTFIGENTGGENNTEAEALGGEDDGAEAMLKLLPEKYRDVMRCLVIEEISVKETADRLDISEAGVRKRFERARKMLKEKLKGGAGDEG